MRLRPAALGILLLHLPPGLGVLAAEGQTRNVVLITADGVRWQDLFRGADSELFDPKKDQGAMDLYQRDTQAERRSVLMPFFWREFAPQGAVLGNRDLGSRVEVANPHKFSYPGYSEILLGAVFQEIDSNDGRRYPHQTLLEFLRKRLDQPFTGVAAFASWETFEFICASEAGQVFVNAGRSEVNSHYLTDGMATANRLQLEALTPWNSVRHDAFTFELAFEFLKEYRPRFLYIGLDETDDWAHDGRYDRVLDSMKFLDRVLERLWRFVEATEGYRGQTSILITTDHGRGRSPADWGDHGDVPGAEETWLAVVGPNTPSLGEVTGGEVVYNAQVAATIARFLNLDFRDLRPEAASPIGAVLRD